MGELVEDVEDADLASIMGPVLDEVIRPHVIAVLGPKANAGPISAPEASALGLLRGHFEPLAAPDPFHALVVHQPARVAQQGRDLAIAIAAVLTGQLDEIGGETLFVLLGPLRFSPGRAGLTERAAGAALGDVQHRPNVLDTGAPTRGAQKFPRAASCRISLSRVRSAMALRRRAFSVSSSFMRLTWLDFRPPYSWRQR